MTDREIMDVWLEAGGEALYDQARQGEGKPRAAAGHQVQEHFKGVVRSVIEAGHVAELAERSRRKGVLP